MPENVNISRTCACDACKKNDDVMERLQRLPEEERDFFEEMWLDNMHLQLDRDYYRAVIEGSWPNADDIIKHIRESREMRLNEMLDTQQDSGV